MAGIASNFRIGYYGRYRKIISVLARYGFEDVVASSPFRNVRWKRIIPTRGGIPVVQYSRYERIRLVCEELGPTFVKFAQILSNRPDMLPHDLIKELEKLQDNVPPFPESQVIAKLEAQYKKPVTALFKSIDIKPIASASVAQVHRAELLDGQQVILKIQRPGIRRMVTADIAILKDLAALLEKNSDEFALFQPLEIINTFEKTIKKELNFSTEATNIERFRKNFRGEERIYVPKVYRELTTGKVLCMEYIEGCKITNIEGLQKIGLDPKALARTGVDLYFRQIFEHGFFHADPHPGNIFILNDRRICYLDFGMMGSIMENDQELLGDLMYYVATNNVRQLSQTVQRIAINPLSDTKDFDYEVKDFLEAINVVSIDQVEMSDVIDGLRDVMFQYKIHIPPQFHLLLRALVIIEGVGLHLDPDYQIMHEIQPYAKKIIERKYHPSTLARKFFSSFREMGSIAANLPGDFKTIIEKVKQGKLHIEFEHKGLDKLYLSFDMLTRRMSFAIVIAAMIIGTALIIHADIPPHIYNIPAIGLIGFFISTFFALILLFSVMRRGRF